MTDLREPGPERVGEHVTITRNAGGGATAACAFCGLEVTTGGPTFGPIPADAMTRVFATMHEHSRRPRRSRGGAR